MNVPVEFYQILNSNEPGFEQCMQIYHEAFPAYERQTDEIIRGRINDNYCMLLAGRAAGKVVCMSILWEFHGTEYIFLDYFAVAGSARGYQVGTKFLHFIINKFLGEGKFLIMEVEHPNYGVNQDDRNRRIKFYQNNGGVILENVQYFLPPLGGSATPLEMQLMILPDPGIFPGEEKIQSLISTIYGKIYLKKYQKRQ